MQEAEIALREVTQQKLPGLDIADNRLLTALTLIQAVGSAMPDEAQESLVDAFRGNMETLATILPAMKGAGMVFAVDAAEKELRRVKETSNFIAEASDAAYYAQAAVDSPMNPEHLSRIMRSAQEFANIYGLDMPQ